jgi:hypothetical protein
VSTTDDFRHLAGAHGFMTRASGLSEPPPDSPSLRGRSRRTCGLGATLFTFQTLHDSGECRSQNRPACCAARLMSRQ